MNVLADFKCFANAIIMPSSAGIVSIQIFHCRLVCEWDHHTNRNPPCLNHHMKHCFCSYYYNYINYKLNTLCRWFYFIWIDCVPKPMCSCPYLFALCVCVRMCNVYAECVHCTFNSAHWLGRYIHWNFSEMDLPNMLVPLLLLPLYMLVVHGMAYYSIYFIVGSSIFLVLLISSFVRSIYY